MLVESWKVVVLGKQQLALFQRYQTVSVSEPKLKFGCIWRIKKSDVKERKKISSVILLGTNSTKSACLASCLFEEKKRKEEGLFFILFF